MTIKGNIWNKWANRKILAKNENTKKNQIEILERKSLN